MTRAKLKYAGGPQWEDVQASLAQKGAHWHCDVRFHVEQLQSTERLMRLKVVAVGRDWEEDGKQLFSYQETWNYSLKPDLAAVAHHLIETAFNVWQLEPWSWPAYVRKQALKVKAE